MQDQDIPQVFLSYANPDQERVTPFFDFLEKAGFNVWYDCKKLMPGQNWNFEIQRALDKSNIVISFLSENSISRRGYVQKELKAALNKLSEKLIDDIYLIPIMLDDGISIPNELKGIQCISANSPDCMSSVEDALTFQLSKLGVETQKLQKKEALSWSFHTQKEQWDGLPGYEVELQFIKLKSDKYPNIHEASKYIQGELLKSLFFCRSTKLDQSPDRFNYGQEKFERTDTYDAHCSEPSIVGRIISVQYAVHWYGAGAAHPNMHFTTYSFVMEPLILIESLQQIFVEPLKALTKIQELVRNELKKTSLGDEDDPHYLDADSVDSGTKDWNDFSSFIFKETSIEFLFSPYQVAAYACGPQFAEISYSEIIELIRPEYKSALNIEYIAYQKMRLLQNKV